MAFKISKDEQKRIDEVAEDLSDLRRELDARIEVANKAIEESLESVNEQIVAYNEKLEEARGIIEDIHSQATSDFEDKSEKWQEGERGEITREWLDHLESIKDNDLSELGEVAIEVIDINEVEDHHTILTENLEQEPNY